jgi:hypothetical protein
MTENSKWFSILDPEQHKEYITFEDNSRGKLLSRGTIRVNESFVLKDVALVSNLHFNLLSVLQLLGDGFEVCFKIGLSQVLDAWRNLVCQIVPFGRVFQTNFHTLLALLGVWWLDLPLNYGSGIGDWFT